MAAGCEFFNSVSLVAKGPWSQQRGGGVFPPQVDQPFQVWGIDCFGSGQHDQVFLQTPATFRLQLPT